MAKIDIVAEQTEFLLKKQSEVLNCFKDGFGSLKEFLKAEQEKAEKVNAGPELQSFQNVYALIEEEEKESVGQISEDVEFLKEQIAAIKEIQKMEDEEQANQITEMMLEGGHELMETEKFKKDVEAESNEAQESFKSMVEDVKAVFEEDGIKELEMLLQAHVEERRQDEKAMEKISREAEEDEEEGKCEASCSSCKGCDIFEGVREE